MSDPVEKKRRKKAEPVLESVEDAAPLPLHEMAPPALSQRELFELRLTEAEVRAASQAAETARLKRLYVLALLDPKGRVAAAERERETALSEIQALRKKYEHIKASALSRLGLAGVKIAGFDGDTGVIHFPDSARG